ncbi:hypothetical protein BG003_008875 [Podila horticola]|nr:hypothetical protein BG003_008875 [Podila horticola]
MCKDVFSTKHWLTRHIQIKHKLSVKELDLEAVKGVQPGMEQDPENPKEHYTMAGKARSDVIISDSDYEASSDDRASDCGSYVDETDSADDEPKTQSGTTKVTDRCFQGSPEAGVNRLWYEYLIMRDLVKEMPVLTRPDRM